MSKTQERSRSKSPGPVIRTSKKRDVPPGVCRFEFNRRGSCKFVDCQFRHEGFIPRLDPRDSSVCFDFQNKGECKRGDDCRFGHTDPKSSVCRDFQVGRCRHGDKCRFQHKYDQRAMPPAPIDWRRPSAPPPRYTPYDAPPADRYGSGYGGPQSYGRYGSGYGQPPADRYSRGTDSRRPIATVRGTDSRRSIVTARVVQVTGSRRPIVRPVRKCASISRIKGNA
eukprot:61538_1